MVHFVIFLSSYSFFFFCFFSLTTGRYICISTSKREKKKGSVYDSLFATVSAIWSYDASPP